MSCVPLTKLTEGHARENPTITHYITVDVGDGSNVKRRLSTREETIHEIVRILPKI